MRQTRGVRWAWPGMAAAGQSRGGSYFAPHTVKGAGSGRPKARLAWQRALRGRRLRGRARLHAADFEAERRLRRGGVLELAALDVRRVTAGVPGPEADLDVADRRPPVVPRDVLQRDQLPPARLHDAHCRVCSQNRRAQDSPWRSVATSRCSPVTVTAAARSPLTTRASPLMKRILTPHLKQASLADASSHICCVLSAHSVGGRRNAGGATGAQKLGMARSKTAFRATNGSCVQRSASPSASRPLLETSPSAAPASDSAKPQRASGHARCTARSVNVLRDTLGR